LIELGHDFLAGSLQVGEVGEGSPCGEVRLVGLGWRRGGFWREVMDGFLLLLRDLAGVAPRECEDHVLVVGRPVLSSSSEDEYIYWI
jgi:hypothetical protein